MNLRSELLLSGLGMSLGGVGLLWFVLEPTGEEQLLLSSLILIGAVMATTLLVGKVVSQRRALYEASISRALGALGQGDRAASLSEDGQHLGQSGFVAGFNRQLFRLDADLRRIRGERDSFASVFEDLDAGLIVLDDEQKIVLTNSATHRLLQLDREVAGAPLVDALRVSATEDILEAARAGEGCQVEFELPGNVDCMIQALCSQHPASGRTIILLLDVTRARMLERVRRDFVTNVSHELRTPVTVIRTNAETLLSGALSDPDASQRFVEGIHRHGERLSALIADLLDLSRIEAGHREMEREPIDLRETLIAAIEGLVPLAEKRSTSLSWSCPEDLHAEADALALDQVLRNLTENAIKYSGQGGAVELVAQAHESRVLIEVRDDGPGIPPQHHARIFERFYRVDRGRSREAGGTGLGLSIVRRLCESMGGACSYRLNQPNGSVFSVELPGFREKPSNS